MIKLRKKSRLFQAIVVLGGAITGPGAMVAGVVAVAPLSACGGEHFSHIDMAWGIVDMAVYDFSGWGHVDAGVYPDLTDGGETDGGGDQ